MAVSQRFIDLLNMPLPALRRLASETDVQVSQGTDKWAIARAVAALPRDELEEASDGYRAIRGKRDRIASPAEAAALLAALADETEPCG